MPDLFELDDLIHGLGVEPTGEQLETLLDEFYRCFVDHPLVVNGLRVKVILKNSHVDGYTNYPETFVHLITRKSGGGKRVFDRHRANKIHWIRCVLENCREEEITFFQYPEDDNTLRDYFWFKEGDFIVILEKVPPDYLVITSFHIDDQRNRDYFEKRYKWYLANK